MAAARQTRLSITYDGTVKKLTTTDDSSSSESSSSESTASTGEVTYTVASGDTLWAIAKKYYGSGIQYTKIYNANSDLIESTAKAHGKTSSDNGHWIWPGEVLTIPDVTETTTTVSETSTATITAEGTSNPELGEIMAESATSVTYTDASSGNSDSITISMHDIEKNWMGDYKPPRGASISADLVTTNSSGETTTFPLGEFTIDDVSFSGRPLSCELGGVSTPANSDFRSKQKTVTWEDTTIKDIAEKIASPYGLAVVYDADDIQIEEMEQTEQTDCAFLSKLCEKYGLDIKVFNLKIVILDPIKYEEADVVATLYENVEEEDNEILSWSYTETVEGTYTGAEITYTNPDLDDPINVTMGEEGRMYKASVQANSQYDAELQAAAIVNAANRKIVTMSVKIQGPTTLCSTQCIQIEGLGDLGGKYYIDSVKHTIGSGGYTASLTLHKVQTPIKVTTPTDQATASSSTTYTVVSGDTLWAIAKKYYGSGSKYGVIYNANSDLIESTARAHGKTSSDNGHWIWPGEVLTIPAES